KLGHQEPTNLGVQGSLVPGTELGVPSSGDPESSLIGDPRVWSCLEAGGNDTGAPLRQDPIPLVLLAWVPLKAELILIPREDRVSCLVSFLGEAVAKKMLAIARRFHGNLVLVGSHLFTFYSSRNIARLPATVHYDEYQQAGTRRRCPFYAPPPRFTRATPPAARIRPLPSRTAIGDVSLVDVQQRLLTELFLLRNRVRDMSIQHDLLIRQVRALTRWGLMKEWLEGRMEHWNPEEENRQHLLWSEGSICLSGGFSQVGSGSAAESRVSAGPPF
ncbi:hypothetical protein HID58_073924, partial [Brassica napus]